MAVKRRKRKGPARRTKKKTRKPAAKARKRTRATKRATRRCAKPKRRATRKATPRRAKRATPRKTAAKRVGSAMAAAAPAAPLAGGLAGKVEATLRNRGYDPPDPIVVEVLTAIGTGYRQGPANPPAWIRFDVDGLIAEGVVERFETGDRAHDIDRATHRGIVRNTVDFNLDQLPGGGSTGDAERRAITSFCLGSWDPSMDENAERNGIASFVVPWYLAGRA
jgi:hypothetical protein